MESTDPAEVRCTLWAAANQAQSLCRAWGHSDRVTTTLNRMSVRKTLTTVAFSAVVVAGCGSAKSNTDKATSVPPTGATTTTQAPVVKGPESTCTYLGTDPDFGYMQADLTFTNTLGEVNAPEVTYALLDGEGGTRFFTGTAGGLDLADIHFPRADEKFRISVDTREKVPPNVNAATIGCRVLAIEEGTDIGGYERATDADTCTVLGVDSRGLKVDVAATSPYKETTKVQVWWALQAPGGVRFDTETKVVDLVGGGEMFRVSGESTGEEIPAWVGDPGGVTCAVVGFWDQGR